MNDSKRDTTDLNVVHLLEFLKKHQRHAERSSNSEKQQALFRAKVLQAYKKVLRQI